MIPQQSGPEGVNVFPSRFCAFKLTKGIRRRDRRSTSRIGRARTTAPVLCGRHLHDEEEGGTVPPGGQAITRGVGSLCGSLDSGGLWVFGRESFGQWDVVLVAKHGTACDQSDDVGRDGTACYHSSRDDGCRQMSNTRGGRSCARRNLRRAGADPDCGRGNRLRVQLEYLR
jgi:hypothetical protein